MTPPTGLPKLVKHSPSLPGTIVLPYTPKRSPMKAAPAMAHTPEYLQLRSSPERKEAVMETPSPLSPPGLVKSKPALMSLALGRRPARYGSLSPPPMGPVSPELPHPSRVSLFSGCKSPREVKPRPLFPTKATHPCETQVKSPTFGDPLPNAPHSSPKPNISVMTGNRTEPGCSKDTGRSAGGGGILSTKPQPPPLLKLPCPVQTVDVQTVDVKSKPSSAHAKNTTQHVSPITFTATGEAQSVKVPSLEERQESPVLGRHSLSLDADHLPPPPRRVNYSASNPYGSQSFGDGYRQRVSTLFNQRFNYEHQHYPVDNLRSRYHSYSQPESRPYNPVPSYPYGPRPSAYEASQGYWQEHWEERQNSQARRQPDYHYGPYPRSPY